MRNLLKNSINRRNIIAGLVGLFFGGTFGFSLILWGSRTAPLVIREAQEVDGVATRNGHIDLYFEFDRIRDCPAETSRWLWTWVDHHGHRIKQFYPLLNTTTTVTDVGRDQRFILSIPIPPGIWPGQWFYWSKTVEHCSLVSGLFQSKVRESNDIPVKILGDVP